jgi:hypothetical protein
VKYLTDVHYQIKVSLFVDDVDTQSTTIFDRSIDDSYGAWVNTLAKKAQVYASAAANAGSKILEVIMEVLDLL